MPTERQLNIILESEVEFNSPSTYLTITQSNEPTIDQKNEAIALFDGWQIEQKFNRRLFIKEKNYLFIGGLEYHTSWDWLMPVWIKFRNLALDNKEFSEWCSSLGWHLYCSSAPFVFHERLYYAIQWYNQQKQTNG